MAERTDCETCGGAIDPVSGVSLYDFDVFAAGEAADNRADRLQNEVEWLCDRKDRLQLDLEIAERNHGRAVAEIGRLEDLLRRSLPFCPELQDEIEAAIGE